MEQTTELGLIIGKSEAEWFNQQLVKYNLKYKKKEPLFKKVTTEELMKLRINSYNYLL